MILLGVIAILESTHIYDYWRDRGEYERMRSMGSFKGSSLILVGASHTLTDIGVDKGVNPKAYP
jgi:hypothetical protein